MRKISVKVDDCLAREVEVGTRVGDLISRGGVVAAMLNNEVVSLFRPLAVNSVVKSLTRDDPHGARVYRWSLCFLLAKAVHEVAPGAEFRVRHSVGHDALYCSLANAADISAIEERLRTIIAADFPITPFMVSYDEALERFAANKQFDKLNLLRHRNPPIVNLAECGGFFDLLQEPIVDRTGLIDTFALTPCRGGFVISATGERGFEETKIFRIYHEHIGWGKVLGVTTAGELNRVILNGDGDETIRTAEALHDKKLSEIAAEIYSPRGAEDFSAAKSPRLVLIAGPSSAGKTTFTKRLAIHLRVLGAAPLMISADDYYLGDERTPRDEAGNLDYEHIRALDLEALGKVLGELIAGNETPLRHFDFATRRATWTEEKVALKGNGIILLEGIHALNPELTPTISRDQKFLIYISALTQLGIDNSVRVSTTDNRLLRRMIRDSNFRGRSVSETLKMWPSVVRGENRWIFPFQENADAMFNSALDYELAVLKPFAAGLLNTVKPSSETYAEARRLSGILMNFAPLAPTAVPGDSILREYIGNSQLKY